MANPDAGVRVTADQVTEIISTGLTTAQVNAFINTAHTMVEHHLGAKGLSVGILTQIELWLSAHLLSIRDQRKKSVKVDDVSVTYQGDTGQGLKATLYGQQALALDYTGTLAALGQKRAGFRVD